MIKRKARQQCVCLTMNKQIKICPERPLTDLTLPSHNKVLTENVYSSMNNIALWDLV